MCPSEHSRAHVLQAALELRGVTLRLEEGKVKWSGRMPSVESIREVKRLESELIEILECQCAGEVVGDA